MNIFVPLTKIDVEKRLIYGTLAAEEVDRSGEIFDYASSKPHFEEWSGDIAKATDGKSVGNLRAMHGKIAAGKFTALSFDDENKRIEACAKVVDDNEWAKVEEGVYTGFSIGGKYGRTWKDGVNKRYEAVPAEGSLVDLPCIKSATFEVVKADGSTELRKFQEPAVQAVDELAKLLDAGEVDPRDLLRIAMEELGKRDFSDKKRAKLADEGKAMKDGSFPIENKEDLENAIKAYGRAKDKDAAKKHIEERAKALGAEDMLPDSWDEGGKDDGKDDEKDKKAKKMAEREELAKGLWTVGTLANLIDSLGAVMTSAEYEAAAEMDGSPIPADLKAAIATLGDILVRFAQEEVRELVGGDEADLPTPEVVMTQSAKVDTLKKGVEAHLAKRGARNSSADQKHLQDAHDALVKAGATCGDMDKEGGEDDDAEKAAAVDELCKAANLTAEGATTLEKVTHLIIALGTANKRVAELEAQPEPPKGALKSMSKSSDMTANQGTHDAEDAMQAELEKAAQAQIDGDPVPMVKFIHKYGAQAYQAKVSPRNQ